MVRRMQGLPQVTSGWGDYPSERCYVTRPDTCALLQTIVATGDQPNYIARELGRAYGDSALNCQLGVIVQTRRNHFLAFDDQTGMLECEAGVSLADIMTYLLPRGGFCPLLPAPNSKLCGSWYRERLQSRQRHAPKAQAIARHEACQVGSFA